ncbi:hypothetical protein JHK82_019020 [Glycine max]|nr:hypothetical protein JHK85_019462 [Glycine max]KAG5143325.1 hypothetical protein JHK82_019020 [Glycine max]
MWRGVSILELILKQMGRTSVVQMLQSPLGEESKCKKFLNIGFGYLHHIGIEDNISPCTCRDATFVVLASQVDEISIIDIAICFFGVQGLLIPLADQVMMLVSESSSSFPAPKASPSPPLVADGPSQPLLSAPLKGNHHSYHLALVQVDSLWRVSINSKVFSFADSLWQGIASLWQIFTISS